MQYIIIGGGIAGITCIEQLYYIINNNNLKIYNNNIILITSTNILKQIKLYTKLTQYIDDIQDIDTIDSQQLIQQYKLINNQYITVNIHTTYVTSIDTSNNIVYTIDSNNRQQSYNYDKLCIATGAIPVTPFNIQSQYIYTIRDTDNISQLINTIQNRYNNDNNMICVLGNGGIALECIYLLLQAYIYNKYNNNTTQQQTTIQWIIKDIYIGNTFFDEKASLFMLQRLFSLLNIRPNIYSNEQHSSNKQYNNNSSNYIQMSNNNKQIAGSGAGPNWLLDLFNQKRSYGHISLYNENTQSYNNELNDNTLQINQNIKLNIHMNCPVDSVIESNNQLQVQLNNNENINCNLLISATGVKPNTSALHNTPIKLSDNSNGIIVDSSMCTNITNIYACGDCIDCSLFEKQNEHQYWFHMKLWSQAYHTAIVAAKSMTDTAELYSNHFTLFTHLTTFFGLKVVLLGLYNRLHCNQLNSDDIYEYTKTDTDNNIYITVLMNKNTDTMIGCTLIGNTELEETYENLIISQFNLTQFGDFVNSDVDIEDYFD